MYILTHLFLFFFLILVEMPKSFTGEPLYPIEEQFWSGNITLADIQQLILTIVQIQILHFFVLAVYVHNQINY